MRVIETFTASKRWDESLNEDAFVVTDHIAAVFDGETNKGAHVDPSPGRLTAQACAKTVAGLESGFDPVEIVAALHEAVRLLDAGPGAAASGAVLDAAAGLVVRVGDVAVGVDGSFDMGSKPSDPIAAAARSALTAALSAQGASADELRADDPGRRMVMPLLLAQRVWRNVPDARWGFGVIDGTATPFELIDVFRVPDGAEVVLASDGYADPRPTLAESEAVLSEALKRDPLCVTEMPSTKGIAAGAVSFDDRTYLRIILGMGTAAEKPAA